MKKKRLSKKAKIFFQTLCLVVLIFVLVFSVFNDWTKILKNKKTINNLNEQYTSLLEQEESLNSEITKLQDPDYVARYAREKYMYSMPGELIIRTPN